MKDTDAIAKSICWCLGDGVRIKFWADDWLGIGNLISHITGPLSLFESQLTVRHFWADSNWNFDTSSLYSFLPTHIQTLIRSNRCLPLGTPDMPYSGLAPKGTFQLNLAYHSLIPPLHRDVDLSWIWRLPTYPKIQFFIWLSFWDRLPHKVTLASRGMQIPTSCNQCPQTSEHTLHILRDCPRAISLWNTLPIDHNFFSLDLRSWLRTNLTGAHPIPPSHTLPPWPTCFSFCIWHLWLRRNEATLSNSFPPLHIWKPKLLAQAWEFTTSIPHTSHTPPPPWQPPPPGWVALNTDGSWSSKDLYAGLGGAFRGPNSEWILGFQRKLPARDPLFTEGLAILEGLQIAKARNWNRLIIYTDSTTIISMISAEQNCPCHAYTNLINECRDWIAKLGAVRLLHQSRTANKTADALAKHARLHIPHALSSNNLCNILEAPPPYCMPFLYDDSSSLSCQPCNPTTGNSNIMF